MNTAVIFLHLALLAVAVISAQISTMSKSEDVFLKPIKTGKENVAVVIIPAPQVKPTQYIPLAAALQDASCAEYSLWVGIAHFEEDVALKSTIAKGIDRILTTMKSHGMSSSTKLFFAAHSSLSSGPALQDYLATNKTLAEGQILMGAFLQRKYRNDSSYPLQTLMISGELDGICRVTRVMEEYFHRIIHASNTMKAVISFPVVIVPGMNHFQFAAGDPPSQIRKFDLRSEILDSNAHASVSKIITSFIGVLLQKSASLSTLTNEVAKTGQFLEPLIDAYTLEGAYQFKKPCNDDPPSSACQRGSHWTERAMVIMAAQQVIQVNNTDEFHPAAQLFPTFHHPDILSKCSTPSKNCIVKLLSVSENVYDKDATDSGLVPTSAKEIRAKLKSRQSVMLAAGYKNVDFNRSDAGSRCKTINQQAYDWALDRSGKRTVSRFKAFGAPLVMGEDEGCAENGGIWIYKPMSYKYTTNSAGGQVLELSSVQLKTPVDYLIGIFAGIHYCKLLSPARAMEWIYVDSLRDYYTSNDKRGDQ